MLLRAVCNHPLAMPYGFLGDSIIIAAATAHEHRRSRWKLSSSMLQLPIATSSSIEKPGYYHP